MNFLAMKTEERNALTEKRNARAAEGAAKLTELDAFAAVLADEKRSAKPDEDELTLIAVDEMRSADADVVRMDAEIDELDKEIAVLEAKTAERAAIPAFVRGSGKAAVEDAYDIELRTAPRTAEVSKDIEQRAFRALEDKDNGLTDEQRSHVEGLLRNGKVNKNGALARHLLVTGRPAYRSAFAKLMRDDKVFTEAEGAALEELRAINITTNTEGGYLMPFTLDPSIVLVNDGRTNPMRQLATVRSVVTDNWQGVNTTGITASMDAEGTEVSSDVPAFTQPAIDVKLARAFVDYTAEAEDDFAGLATDITALIGDAFDELEATQFATGSGTGNNVQGIVTGLLAGSSDVQTATAATYALADIDALSDAVPDRYDSRAVFLMHRKIITATRGLAPSDDPVKHLDSAGPMIVRGRQAYKYSKLDSTVATDAEIAICGDIASTYRIHDRLGVTVERVPMLFATANNLPNGRRGWYARKRFGAGVVNANASRVLQVG